MKKIYFLMGAWAVSALIACHHHNHEEQHSHETKAEAGHDEHAHHDDEIILPEKNASTAGIVTETVKPDTFRRIIKTGGQILAAPGEEITVAATTAGIVRFARTLTAGTHTAHGNILLHLTADRIEGGDPTERARITYQNARKEYERALPLAEKQIVTQKELENLKAASENARIAYEALAPSHSRQGTAIAAPAAGYVKTILVKEGEYVTTGQPLLTLTKNRRLQLRADVSERHYNALSQISSAHFRTPYDNSVYALEKMHGHLLSVGKSQEKNSPYIPVVFEFDNTGNIVEGGFAEVFLTGDARTNVITVPVSALTEEQGLYFVYLQEDKEIYRKQEVKTGADDGLRIEILTGLKPGDRIVTQGAYHVKLASASNIIPAHTHSH